MSKQVKDKITNHTNVIIASIREARVGIQRCDKALARLEKKRENLSRRVKEKLDEGIKGKKDFESVQKPYKTILLEIQRVRQARAGFPPSEAGSIWPSASLRH